MTLSGNCTWRDGISFFRSYSRNFGEEGEINVDREAIFVWYEVPAVTNLFLSTVEQRR